MSWLLISYFGGMIGVWQSEKNRKPINRTLVLIGWPLMLIFYVVPMLIFYIAFSVSKKWRDF